MKLFGIAMAMGQVLRYMEEAGEGGEGAAATTETKAPTTDLGGDTSTKAADTQPKSDNEVLDAAGYAAADNDPGLNYAMSFLAKNGFNADDPAVAAAFGGDFSLLKAQLAQKGIQGWEQAVGLAEQSYERFSKEENAKADKVGEIVTSFAESQGVDWEAAVKHIGTSATAEQKTALNTLLKDPATAEIAAMYITTAYRDGGDTEIQPAARATGDETQRSAGAAGGLLSRAEYTREMAKLRDTLGENYINSPQAQALYRRRG